MSSLSFVFRNSAKTASQPVAPTDPTEIVIERLRPLEQDLLKDIPCLVRINLAASNQEAATGQDLERFSNAMDRVEQILLATDPKEEHPELNFEDKRLS